MFLFLYSAGDYDDGNAVGVIAPSLEEADVLAATAAHGFDVKDCDVERLPVSPGVVFMSSGYYRNSLHGAAGSGSVRLRCWSGWPKDERPTWGGSLPENLL